MILYDFSYKTALFFVVISKHGSLLNEWQTRWAVLFPQKSWFTEISILNPILLIAPFK